MKRKTIVRVHILASLVAVITITTFFISSLVAEVIGDESFIKQVKEGILYSLPVMLLVMPVLAISGNKLVGQSKNPVALVKQKRMKFVLVNGIALLFFASFLYYSSHYQTIDWIFLTAQLAEFAFGLVNLTLIGMNIKSGFQLSGRFRK